MTQTREGKVYVQSPDHSGWVEWSEAQALMDMDSEAYFDEDTKTVILTRDSYPAAEEGFGADMGN